MLNVTVWVFNSITNDKEIISTEYNALFLRDEDRKVRSMKLKKNIKLLTHSRLSNWQKFNRFFRYPGEKIKKKRYASSQYYGRKAKSIFTDEETPQKL